MYQGKLEASGVNLNNEMTRAMEVQRAFQSCGKALTIIDQMNQKTANDIEMCIRDRYVTQLAQISTMQQMEEMSYNAKSTYVASLVGKYVAAAKFTVSGELKKTEGIVDKISLLDEKFVIYVNGESYNMDEIMEIKTEPANNPDDSGNKKPGEDKNPEEGSGKA